ncbi:hypothetical protein MGG_16142 [Pyricularia oryzae 70-15]|uniref:Uncharacterized protein n=2 Tax=Pyricularia oryzae TaxID=318829 RepID=G4MKN8_PYRO7|nr:uncharacterized protein MGG_16142 [Pyricularia oryzae 70-15]EHA56728.1 hypothetical protein MGG_16142 [Pyricularia oryzae 70-15]KAI7921576.1 hypothetical protein M0657_006012 [Pyricularia oryzae]KAI7930166.1 hypothetical protein M9X92_000941 [Pyricularia oryzae]QBZ53935.1 hypothetical protein PoMZ_09625 [Pyricularia oryzae]
MSDNPCHAFTNLPEGPKDRQRNEGVGPGSLAQRNTICNTTSDTRTNMQGGLGGT